MTGVGPVTKSKAMWDPGREGEAVTNREGRGRVSLAWAQTEQAAIKSTMSPLISGHQNLRWMNA